MDSDKPVETGLNFTPPKSVISAIAQIQQWYLAEKRGQPFDSNFFTIEHTVAYTELCMKEAIRDSLAWLLIYVLAGSVVLFLQSNYLQTQTTTLLFWEVQGSPLYLFVKASSFAFLAFTTFFCMWGSRFYIGGVPKKALGVFIFVRALFLICIAFMGFALLGLIYKFTLSDTFVQSICSVITVFNKQTASDVYYFLTMHFRRLIFESAMLLFLASFVSALLPFLSTMFFAIVNSKSGFVKPSNAE